MKIKSFKLQPAPDETIGWFGEVKVVRRGDGKHDLVRGKEKERGIIRAWCAQNAPFLEFVERDEGVLAA